MVRTHPVTTHLMKLVQEEPVVAPTAAANEASNDKELRQIAMESMDMLKEKLQAGSPMWYAFITILTLVLLGLIGFGVWKWKKHQEEKQNQRDDEKTGLVKGSPK